MRSKRLAWLLLLPLLALAGAPRAHPENSSPSPFTAALWLPARGELLKLGLVNGSVLRRFADLPAASAVAVDSGEGRLWALVGGRLHALDFDGQPLAEVDLSAEGGAAKARLAAMLGHAWVGFSRAIYELDSGGSLVRSWPTGELRDLAIDSAGRRIYFADGAKVSGFDTDGHALASWDAGAAVTALGVEVPAGSLWVATASAVHRLDRNLRPVWTQALSGVRRLAPDGQGEMWVGRAREVLRLRGNGQISLRTSLPFSPGSAGLLSLGADPNGAALWVGLEDRLLQLGRDGRLLATVKLAGLGSDLAASSLAVYRDRTPPTLTLRSPQNGAYLGQKRPELVLDWTDDAIGVDSASVALRLDGSDVAIACTETSQGGRCRPGLDLEEGAHQLALDLADFEGNRSAPATLELTVDTLAPSPPRGDRIRLHRPSPGVVEIEGSSGAAEAGSQVRIENLTRGGVVEALADNQGRFTAALAGEGRDLLSLTATDRAGNRSLPLTVSVYSPIELAPLSPQAITLGSSFTLGLQASGGNGSAPRFAVAPLPLPDGARFDGALGILSFRPSTDQLGRYTWTFSVSDGESSASQTTTLTVSTAPAGTPTTLSGRILDTSAAVNGTEVPVIGARVRLLGGGTSVLSGADGRFTLTGLTGGSQVLDIDSTNAQPAPDGTHYASFREGLEVLPGTANVIDRPFYLPRIDPASLTQVDPAQTTVVTNPNLGVSLTLPPGVARAPGGGLFTGQLSVSQVPSSLAPVALPEELAPALLLTVQPVGVTFSSPVPVSMPNLDGLAPGNELDLWSVNAATGQFEVVGVGRVSADGSRIETVSGGIRAASWHALLPPQPQSDGDDNNEDNQDQQKCTECQTGSATALATGHLTVSHDTPAYFSLSAPHSLRLLYHSGTADPRPIVTSRVTIPVRAAVPPRLSVRAELGGTTVASDWFTDTSRLDESQDETVRQVVQLDATDLPTGRYPVRLRLTSRYAGSAISSFQAGHTLVVNRIASPFGAGWGLAGLARLLPQADGSVLVEDGDGSLARFAPGVEGVSLSSLRLNGAAARLVGGDGRTVLRLTTTTGDYQTGTAFLPTPLALTANGQPVSFSSTFEFRISQLRAGGADGLTFLLSPSPTAQGGPGVGIGYAGISPSVVVEFDTYANPEWGDPNANHVGINLNGVLRSLEVATPPFSLKNGLAKFAWVDYDGPSRRLEVRLAETADRPAGPLLAQTVDLPAVMGSRAYFGFTAATGGDAELHDLLRWGLRVGSDELPTSTSQYQSPAGDFSTLNKNADGSFTRRFANGLRHEFDAQGRLVAAVDRNGNRTAYAYDAQGRLLSIADPVGLATELRYSGERLAAIVDPGGRETRFEHDAAGNLVRILDTDGSTREFGYDQVHHLIRQRDERGFETQYTFDFAGRNIEARHADGSSRQVLAQQTVGLIDPASGMGTPSRPAAVVRPAEAQARFVDGNGNTTRFEVDRFGGATVETDSLGPLPSVQRDAAGNPVAILEPNGLRRELAYDGRGNLVLDRRVGTGGDGSQEATAEYHPTWNLLTRLTDPLGNTTRLEYDERGNRLREIDALGGVKSASYDAHGLLLSSTDANGHTTLYGYDAAGNLARETDPLGVETRYDRDAWGRVVSITEALGLAEARTSTFAYDAKNRLLAATDALGATTTTVYDAAGNATETHSPTGEVVLRRFDAENRLVERVDPASGIRQLAYDGNGELIRIVESDGATRRIERDARYRPLRIVDELGGEELRSYDLEGNLVRRTNPLGKAWTFSYDSFNRLRSTTDPLGQTVAVETYDAADRRLRLDEPTPGGLRSRTFRYDALGRPTEASTADNTVRWSYDLVGNLLSVVDSDSQVTFRYDAQNRVMESRTSFLDGSPEVAVSSGYDAVGNRVALADSLGGDTETSFDAAGRPTRLAPAGGAAIDLGYDLAGRLLHLGLGNGLSSDRSYDGHGRLVSLIERDAAGLPLSSLAYRYDSRGRIVEIAEDSRVRQYAYDLAGRLIAGGTGALRESYSYDSAGNRTSSHLSASYQHDAADQLVGDDTSTYAYSPTGDLEAKTPRSGAPATRYLWDAQHQLVGLDLADGTAVRYRYDGLGRRIEKRVGSEIRRYVYDGLNLRLELDGAGQLLVRYHFGPGLDRPLAMDRGGERSFYLADHQGSIRYLTSSSGQAENHYEYDSFGRLLVAEEAVANPFTYTGREQEAESGLTFFRARFYDPTTGRFESRDPLGFGGGDLNLYRYVSGDPVNRVDPLGLEGRLSPPGGLATGLDKTEVEACGTDTETLAESFGQGLAIELVVHAIVTANPLLAPAVIVIKLGVGAPVAEDYLCHEEKRPVIRCKLAASYGGSLLGGALHP
ncbi:MAG: RHS repeat-associated core domain-containing protein [Thermoanaerobaculia bacterium]